MMVIKSMSFCPYGDLNCDICDSSCHYTSGQTSYCGDGRVDLLNNESCDDGNLVGGDGCNSSCNLESCGDGIINQELGEECDDGLDNGGPCDYGSSSCLRCSEQCRTVDGSLQLCGDGILQDGEGCDDGNLVNEADCEYGVRQCQVCNSFCQEEERPAHYCGDGQIDREAGETCDDGNTELNDGCDDTCHQEYCGNSIAQSYLGESCDDGNRIEGDGCDNLSS